MEEEIYALWWRQTPFQVVQKDAIQERGREIHGADIIHNKSLHFKVKSWLFGLWSRSG